MTHIRLPLLVLIAALHGSSCAQSALEPCDRKLSDPYHAAVNKVIDGAVAQPSRLLLTTFPSFEPESGLRLAGSGIYFVTFQSSFWGQSYICNRKGVCRMDFSKPKARTKVSYAALSAPVAVRVERVVAKAIAQVEDSRAFGLDGVSYVLSTPDGACGWAWSPAPQSRNGRLVQLMQRLEKHTAFSMPVDLQRSEQALVQLLETMERD